MYREIFPERERSWPRYFATLGWSSLESTTISQRICSVTSGGISAVSTFAANVKPREVARSTIAPLPPPPRRSWSSTGSFAKSMVARFWGIASVALSESSAASPGVLAEGSGCRRVEHLRAACGDGAGDLRSCVGDGVDAAGGGGEEGGGTCDASNTSTAHS